MIETKVAAGGAAGVFVSTVLGSLQTWLSGFIAPPAYLTGLFITLLGLLAGYYAPHTPRAVQPPKTTIVTPISSARPAP